MKPEHKSVGRRFLILLPLFSLYVVSLVFILIPIVQFQLFKQLSFQFGMFPTNFFILFVILNINILIAFLTVMRGM